MIISVLGIIMVVSTIIIAGYIGFNAISSGISSSVSEGGQYDQLAILRSDYLALEGEFNDKKSVIMSGSDKETKEKFIATELELVRANSAINDVESALKSKKTEEAIDLRIATAKEKLKIAGDSLKEL